MSTHISYSVWMNLVSHSIQMHLKLYLVISPNPLLPLSLVQNYMNKDNAFCFMPFFVMHINIKLIEIDQKTTCMYLTVLH